MDVLYLSPWARRVGMKTSKRCIICGKPGKARLNGQVWLCGEHAHAAAIASLVCGVPVVEAVRGEPRYLLMPASGISKN